MHDKIGVEEQGWYYDHERYLPFWERVESLGVPLYLHPRNPLPANAGIYEGHPELMGPSGPSPSRPPPTRSG